MLNYSLLQRHNKLLIGGFILFTKARLVSALYVVESSNCTALCNGPYTGSTTNVTDVSCYDDEYNTTGTGVSFRSCTTCELNSDAVDTTSSQTDIGWALFNMRFTLDQCLYNNSQSHDKTPAAQCVSPCSAIKTQLETNLDQPNVSTPYEYCAGASFRQNAQECAQCYRIINNQIYLSNFLNTLATACEPLSSQFPVASSDIFTTHPPSNFSNVDHNDGLSHNGKVAIAIAVPIVIFVVLSISLIICFVYRSTRRRRKRPQSKQRPPKPGKRVSPTTTSSSPEHVRFPKEARQGFQSRDASNESRHARLSSPLSRYTPERIPLPRPMKARKSPIPVDQVDSATTEQLHPAKVDQFGFTKRVEVPVPNTTPREYISEEEDHVPTARTAKQVRAPAKPDLSTDPLPLFFAISSEEYKKAKKAQSEPHMTPLKTSTPSQAAYRNAAPTSAYSVNKGPRVSVVEAGTATRGLKPPSKSQHSRLLTGSPFDAQSLATLGTVTETEAPSRAPTSHSSRTPKHTPSHSSSNRHRSDSGRTAAPAPLPAQSITPREQVNDPALARAIPSTLASQPDDESPSLPTQGHETQMDTSPREKINDPALSRALASSTASEQNAVSSTRQMRDSLAEGGTVKKERVQDPALSRALVPSLAQGAKAGALPTATGEESLQQEKQDNSTLSRAPKSSFKRAKARELSFPLPNTLSVSLAAREQIKDPALSRAMPSSPVLRPLAPLAPPSPSQERSYTPEPKMHADTGFPSYHDLARQIAQAQAKASLTDLRGDSSSPKISKTHRSSSTRSKMHGSHGSSSRSRTPKSPMPTSVRLTPKLHNSRSFPPRTIPDDARSISPGTVPGGRPLEQVQEEPQRRPTSPVSPGTVPARDRSPVRQTRTPHTAGPATVDFSNVRPHGRPSTPISPGTLPEVRKTSEAETKDGKELLQSGLSNPVFPQPGPPGPKLQGLSTSEHQRPEAPRRRPTSPVSPGTIPASAQSPGTSQPEKQGRRPSPRRRPTSPISPGTIPADRRHSSLLLQQPPTQQHLQPPKSPRPQSDISPKTVPTARFQSASPPTPQRDQSIDSTIFYLDTSLSSGDGSTSVASSGFIPLQRQESRAALLAGQGVVIRGAGMVRPSRGTEHGGRPAEERGAEQHGGGNGGVRWKGAEGDVPAGSGDAAALRRAEVRNSRGKRLGEEMFKSSRFRALERSS